MSMEPPRRTALHLLHKPFAARVVMLLKRLEDLGFDPIVYETLRSEARQRWLYGVGRTHDLDRKPVTWTLWSKHINGKAADIISKSRLWDHPRFYNALAVEARKLGLRTIKGDQCHVEWRG